MLYHIPSDLWYAGSPTDPNMIFIKQSMVYTGLQDDRFILYGGMNPYLNETVEENNPCISNQVMIYDFGKRDIYIF